jgi:hypothetical protein
MNSSFGASAVVVARLPQLRLSVRAEIHDSECTAAASFLTDSMRSAEWHDARRDEAEQIL